MIRAPLLITLLLICSGCSQSGRIVGAAPAELAKPEGIDVLFNHRDGSRYRSPISGEWRNGDDLEQALIDAINSAEREILVAIQQLTLPKLAKALIAAQGRGVQVQVILENTYNIRWSRQQAAHLPRQARQRLQRLRQLADRNGDGITSSREAADADAVALLQRAGIPLIDDTEDGSRGSGLMHHKFIVIDGAQVLTGSANATSSGLHGDAGAPNSRGNVNHLLSIHSRELADLFREEFQRMWGDGPGRDKNSLFGLAKESGGVETVMVGDTRIDVLFAPHRKREALHGLTWLGDQLARAQRSIDLALFVFSAQQLTSVLEERVEAGLEVRLLADPGFASRPYSEILDLLGVTLPDRDCKVERGNQPLDQPLKGVGTPRLARGDKLHHKFAVIDNRTVITGSFNWSPSAAHTNDETLLVIHSPQLAQHFTREMNRMWRSAELGITPHIQRKLDRQRIKCRDGVERE
ncbi:phospholipase D-like domain-containing protein [Synechococcus sp. KORDI-100]|uniref:phospholipase D-like domain-containing protein n=1 Tax=Synechococcus sp. KORDI-100 TaxID=1280380 RepID=UPI00057158C5